MRRNNWMMKQQLAMFLFMMWGVTAFISSAQSVQQVGSVYAYAIPTEGNSWVITPEVQNATVIKKGGIQNWSSPETAFRTWFKTDKVGSLTVGLMARMSAGEARVRVTIAGESKVISIKNTDWDTVQVGGFTLQRPGYHSIEIHGLEKSGTAFPEIQHFLIGGKATTGKVFFAKDDFYWARRGPSVHLGFRIPEGAGKVQYFYNEITVPEGNDVMGSYFMANGFGQGYFGMQVNSPEERRVLFSVWSPYTTDNPDEIPDHQKIRLLKKGAGVYTGEFGNEGSGGQSFLRYNWKAGTTYQFLLKGQPTGEGETDYTAWFFAPQTKHWQLIASFRRPETSTYLTGLYSFLENFYPETGDVTRRGWFSNQWIYTTQNQWVELTKIKFTADATARKEARMDYAGGLENGVFYLKNCGFFSDTTPIDSFFERPATGRQPTIDFDRLP